MTSRVRSVLLCAVVLGVAACGASRADAPESVALSTPAPVSHSTEPIHAPPAHVSAEAAHGGGTLALSDRALFDLLMRLAREPGAASELAPSVYSVHEPMEGADSDEAVARGEPVRELVDDVGALLRRYPDPVFVSGDDDTEGEVVVTCDVTALTCDFQQEGGTTQFVFAREGDRVTLHEHRWEYP